MAGFLKSKHVANAMLLVDRANYAPADPYNDSPQLIGFRATISAPHMHAAALEELFPNIMVISEHYCIAPSSG
jgi:protein-L-isoaspartate(D-aspartate) O-methyltransferase